MIILIKIQVSVKLKLQMRSIPQIRVESEMPCTIRSSFQQRGTVQGLTKRLTRDSAIVLVCSEPAPAWLQSHAEIIISVALSVHRNFYPRFLEIAATVTETRVQEGLLRVIAAIHRMTFVDRDEAAGNNPKKLTYRR
jgi:hypothetical protein